MNAFNHPLARNKKQYKGYTVFTFKFNGVPIDFVALKDVERIVEKLSSNEQKEE